MRADLPRERQALGCWYLTADHIFGPQIITGEAEINAATTMTALTFSPLFDLRKTYFLIAGIAGVNPYGESFS